MMRLLLKMIFLMTTFFALIMGLLRVRSADNHNLRAFIFPPEDCSVPCWQGLQPGTTTIYEVMALLKDHAWVSQVHHENYSTFSNGYVRWTWSALRPDFISEYDLNNLWYDESVAQDFYMETRVSFGEIWLLLGEPDWTKIYRLGQNHLRVNAAYASEFMIVVADITCSASLLNLWQTKSNLTWMREMPEVDGDTSMVLDQRVLCWS